MVRDSDTDALVVWFLDPATPTDEIRTRLRRLYSEQWPPFLATVETALREHGAEHQPDIQAKRTVLEEEWRKRRW